MKVLITGKNGQLGHEVVNVLVKQEIQCLGVDIDDFDLANCEEAKRFIRQYAPTIIIHCAAYTQVDNAEDDSLRCYSANVVGTKNILEVAQELGSKIVFISTEYVFDGNASIPYEIADFKNPLSVYGKSKAQAEDIVKAYEKAFIVRTSWVFGKNGKNFVKTMVNLAKTRTELNVVSNQIGSPTYAKDLAEFLCELAKTSIFGVYHATNEGYCSWADFATEIFKVFNLKVKVNYINSDDYPTRAKRPLNSRLSKRSIIDNGFQLLPAWQDALREYCIEELNESQS